MILEIPLSHRLPGTRVMLSAVVAGWLFPGLGHVLIGQRRRGLMLALTIGGLWTAGLAIGGISVIEHRDQDGVFRPWFLGQMLVAPSLPVDHLHLRLRREHRRSHGGDLPMPGHETIPYVPAYGRAHEQGTLYTSLAGLLNLLAMVHVVCFDPRQHGGHPVSEAGEQAGGADVG